jgi:type IV secretion system protein VirD4
MMYRRPPRPIGRQDRTAPTLSPAERALAAGLTVLVVGFGCWHAAVWATSRGLGLGRIDLTIRALASGHPLAGLGPRVVTAPAWFVVAVFVVVLSAVTIAGIATAAAIDTRWRRRTAKGLADAAAVRRHTGIRHARASAAFTRPTTYTRPGGRTDRRAIARAPLTEVGWLVGHQQRTRQPVVASHDDSVGVLAPTGAGKTRRVVVRACLDAIGPLVMTSTRADALDVIAEPAVARGRLWVFDPLGSVGWPQPMVWDPVAGCADGQTAMARGESFVFGVGADNDGATNAAFFRDAAKTAIQVLCHAAALSGRGMDAVVEWAINLSVADEPRAILRNPKAEPAWHDLLVSVATGADETVSSTRTTLTNKLRPLMLRQVMRSVVPVDGVPTFNADAFVRSTDTLVLICDSNAPANVAPLTTMLFDETIEAAKRAARRSAGGRLDPPLRCMAEEVSNVAPLPKFPGLASDSRALGIQLMWSLQSLSAAEERWGPLGARTLWGNTTVRLVMGGHADPTILRELSELLGEVDVTDIQTSYSSQGWTTHRSVTESRTEKRVLRPGEIRQLDEQHALAIVRTAPGILLRLPDWADRPDATSLRAGETLTRARRATPSAGPETRP